MCLRTLKFETMLLQNWDITSNFYIAILQSYDSSPTIYCCMLRLVLCSAPLHCSNKIILGAQVEAKKVALIP